MAYTGSQAVTGRIGLISVRHRGMGAEKYTNGENIYSLGGGIVNRAYRRYFESFAVGNNFPHGAGTNNLCISITIRNSVPNLITVKVGYKSTIMVS